MGTGKRKIEIKKIEDKKSRLVTFSKRRQGLFKKAHQLHALTGSHVAVLVFSPGGVPYVHGSPSFDAAVDRFLRLTDDGENSSDQDRDRRRRRPSSSNAIVATTTDDEEWRRLEESIDGGDAVDRFLCLTDNGENSADQDSVATTTDDKWRHLTELITFDGEGCDDVRELRAMKRDLEMVRERIRLELQYRDFVGSLF